MGKLVLILSLTIFTLLSLQTLLYAQSAATEGVDEENILVTKSPWMIKTYIIHPGHDLNEDGVVNTNMLHELDSEHLDDVYVFDADGTYYQHQGDLLHPFYQNDIYIRGTWSLKEDDMVIQLTITDHDGVALEPPVIEDLNIIELDSRILRTFYQRGEDIADVPTLHIYQEMVPQEIVPGGINHVIPEGGSTPFSTDLLVSESPWMLRVFSIYPHTDLNADGIASTDMMDEIGPEVHDDLYFFDADGTYYQHQGDLSHPFYQNDRYILGTWRLKEDNMVIERTVTENDGIPLEQPIVEDFYILELKPHTLKLFHKRWEGMEGFPTLHIYQEAVPRPDLGEEDYSNVFFKVLSPGLNMISPPLEPVTPYTARSLAEEIGATVVIKYDMMLSKFVGFTLGASGDGFDINGGEGYIVNVPEARVVPFVGAAWTNSPPVEAAPPAQTSSAWAFVVSGSVLDGDRMSASDSDYNAIVKSLRTGEIYSETLDSSGYFAAAWADLSRKAVISAGDKVEVAVVDSSGSIVSGPFVHDITLDSIRNAVVNVHLKLGDIIPAESALLQNYPDPLNPETWIPYHLSHENPVVIKIYGVSGQLIRTLDLGHKDAGIYASRSKAAYWDGKNDAGEEVTSGVYFYSITAGDFSAMRKMVVKK